MKIALRLLLVVATLAGSSPALRAQCLQLLYGPGPHDSVCIYSPNNAQLWNATPFWDVRHGLHDLAEGGVVPEIRLLDQCGDAVVRFALFLDLNGDNHRETVLTDYNLLSGGRLLFNNAGNPGYSGGDTLAFDSRPVAPDQKYRFARTESVSGDTLVVRLVWTTAANPAVDLAPFLPLGTHAIRWVVIQGSDTTTYEGLFTVRDCLQPEVFCIGNLGLNILSSGMTTLWATDVLQYTLDNVTPSYQIELAIERSMQTSGFFPLDDQGNPQQSVTFYCTDDLGPQGVMLWARDREGKTVACSTTVILQDNLNACGSDPTGPVGCLLYSCDTTRHIDGASVQITGNHPALPPFQLVVDAYSGCYDIGAVLPLPIAGNFEIKPFKNNDHLNGVTTFDLVLIARHILGLEPLNTPYKWLAADANRSNSVTSFDIIELRRLILGIYPSLPNALSWRFLHIDHVIPDPTNPFQNALLPESIQILNGVVPSSLDFIAIKVGDVNCSAMVDNVNGPLVERNATVLAISDRALQAGETAELSLETLSANDWYGLQFALSARPDVLEILAVEPGDLPGMDENAFHVSGEGQVLLSWFDALPHHVEAGAAVVRIKVRAKKDTRIQEAFVLDAHRLEPEAYASLDQIERVGLLFRQPDAKTTLYVGTPYPNPTTAGVYLPVLVHAPIIARLELYDLSGRSVWQADLDLSAGLQEIYLDAAIFPDAGTYIWRLEGHVGKISRQRD